MAAQIIKKAYLERFPNAKIIMAGDFNADVNQEPEVEPIRRLLLNPFDILKVPIDQRITETYFDHYDNAHPSQLDNLFVSPNMVDDVVSVEVVPNLDEHGRPKRPPTTHEEAVANDSDHNLVKLVVRTGKDFRTPWLRETNENPKLSLNEFLYQVLIIFMVNFRRSTLRRLFVSTFALATFDRWAFNNSSLHSAG